MNALNALLTDLWSDPNLRQLTISLLGIAVSILLFHQVFKRLLQSFIKRLARQGDAWAFKFLQDDKLIFWVLSLPYLTIIHQGIKWASELPAVISIISNRLTYSLYIVLALVILSNVFRVINSIYNQSEISRIRPIKGYLQSIQILASFMGFICILSIMLDKSPLIFLSGLGAMTAVLLLVFKDTILSFVAGVQLTSNDLIRVGDWVEMPQFNADGDVIEIALNTVKVQNWDKTITVIPAHKFLENSFRNWRGMTESGGRRIKRSILIDLNNIKFLDENDLKYLSKIRVLKEYITTKSLEIKDYNAKLVPGLDENNINFRKLTNVGTFRAYVVEYLKTNPQIHKNMTFLVRQLAPKDNGLPIEIYVFTNDTRWAVYESIQADIFDHLFAVLPEFGLRAFQNPSGADLQGLQENSSVFSDNSVK